MTTSSVISKTINKDELKHIVESYKARNPHFFSYKESVTELVLQEGIEEEALREPFQLLRLFSEQEEWVIRPVAGGFTLVIIGEVTRSDAHAVPLQIVEERLIFLDKNVVSEWDSLEIVQYESLEHGPFMRWKGVRS